MSQYNFSLDEHEKNSYYVKFETKKGKETILWGNYLEELIEKYNITNDNWVRFAITGQEPVKKKIYDKKTGQWSEKIVYKNIWDCSVEGKREVELKPLSESEKKKSEYKILGKEKSQASNITLQSQTINKRQNNNGVSKAKTLQNTQKTDKTKSNNSKEAVVKKQDVER